MRRGPKNKVPCPPCPNPLHAGSAVKGDGRRTTATGTRQRFECRPVAGNTHGFTVLVELPGDAVPTWSPPPRCSAHPGGHVVRAGTYRKKAGTPRQRYRCYPDPLNKKTFHVFTPVLPRDHVHLGDQHCDDCDEIRGVHRGETAVARRHRWSTRTVARALYDLSGGASYADVSRWAKSEAGVALSPSTAPVLAPGASSSGKPKNMRSAQSHNVWHLAADWTEVFSPVLFADQDSRLRPQALAERARLDQRIADGLDLDTPQVWLIDDIPVYSGKHLKPNGTYGRAIRFHVIVVSEVEWSGDPIHPAELGREVKLRLVRAMPKANEYAWRLAFDEVGYTPDFIVADAATGLRKGVGEHFGDATRFVPSLWHLTQAIYRALMTAPQARQPGAGGDTLRPELAAHLHLLRRGGAAFDSPDDWSGWWDGLYQLMYGLDVPFERIALRRTNYEDGMRTVIDDLRRYPQVPVSTGGLETVMAKYVQPVLEVRRSWLGNIERTNRLMDLVVCRQHGVFDNLADVARLLRTDATSYGGWAPPVREVADRKSSDGSYYSSLTDPTLLPVLAKQAGLV